MFGRGTWAIFGLAKESLETFRKSLEDRSHMAASSQVAAAAVARQYGSDAIGINPFNAPRLDEDNTMAPEHQEALAMYAMTEQEARQRAAEVAAQLRLGPEEASALAALASRCRPETSDCR